MTIFTHIMMFGWIPLSVFLFWVLIKPQNAVLFTVIGGWLFLPMTSYNLPGIPIFEKSTAIAIGLILGGRISGHRQASPFKWQSYDLPMIVWCIFCPIATSISNKLGLYDGLSGAFQQTLIWGVPYLAGRIYFYDKSTLRDLCLWIIIGGLLYVPLCLYEIRMSPQLSKIFYGFFPHSFAQHFRYGSYRPIVFMQHGLMVALWLALSSIVAFWMRISGNVKHIKGLPMTIIAFLLIITAILCRSANAWFALSVGCGSFVLFRLTKTTFPFRLLLLMIPVYIFIRSSDIISSENIQSVASLFFDEQRVSSLKARLTQENLFNHKTLVHPLFGWGGWGRGRPIDPDTGELILKAVDSLWVIVSSQYGFFGLSVLISAMLIGPWNALKTTSTKIKELGSSAYDYIVLSLVVILFMIDSLFNAMLSPVYILCSGALVSLHIAQQKKSPSAQKLESVTD